MNCLTVAAKRFCLILGVLFCCSFIAATTLAQLPEQNVTNLNYCLGSKPLPWFVQGSEESLPTECLANDIVYAQGVASQDGFFENFDQGRADNWVDDESGVWSVTDKVYRMNGTGAGVLRASCYNLPFNNFTYQIDVSRTQGDPKASQGMVFRLASNGDFYIFAVAAIGYYSAFKFDVRTGVELIPWTATPVIKQGMKAWNTMKVVCNGPDLDFYLNGTLLKTVKDNAPYLSGMVGIFAVDETKSNQGYPMVEFDNIKLSVSGNLSPSDLPLN